MYYWLAAGETEKVFPWLKQILNAHFRASNTCWIWLWKGIFKYRYIFRLLYQGSLTHSCPLTFLVLGLRQYNYNYLLVWYAICVFSALLVLLTSLISPSLLHLQRSRRPYMNGHINLFLVKVPTSKWFSLGHLGVRLWISVKGLGFWSFLGVCSKYSSDGVHIV